MTYIVETKNNWINIFRYWCRCIFCFKRCFCFRTLTNKVIL